MARGCATALMYVISLYRGTNGQNSVTTAPQVRNLPLAPRCSNSAQTGNALEPVIYGVTGIFCTVCLSVCLGLAVICRTSPDFWRLHFGWLFLRNNSSRRSLLRI